MSDYSSGDDDRHNLQNEDLMMDSDNSDLENKKDGSSASQNRNASNNSGSKDSSKNKDVDKVSEQDSIDDDIEVKQNSIKEDNTEGRVTRRKKYTEDEVDSSDRGSKASSKVRANDKDKAKKKKDKKKVRESNSQDKKKDKDKSKKKKDKKSKQSKSKNKKAKTKSKSKTTSKKGAKVKRSNSSSEEESDQQDSDHWSAGDAGVEYGEASMLSDDSEIWGSNMSCELYDSDNPDCPLNAYHIESRPRLVNLEDFDDQGNAVRLIVECMEIPDPHTQVSRQKHNKKLDNEVPEVIDHKSYQGYQSFSKHRN